MKKTQTRTRFYPLTRATEKTDIKRATIQSWASKGLIESKLVEWKGQKRYEISKRGLKKIKENISRTLPLSVVAERIDVPLDRMKTTIKTAAHKGKISVAHTIGGRVCIWKKDFKKVKTYLLSVLPKSNELIANEFAREAGVTLSAVKGWTDNGIIQYEKRGRRYFVLSSELNRIKEIKRRATEIRIEKWRKTKSKNGFHRDKGLAVKIICKHEGREYKGYHEIADFLDWDVTTLYWRLKNKIIKTTTGSKGVRKITSKEVLRLKDIEQNGVSIYSLLSEFDVSRKLLVDIIKSQKIKKIKLLNGYLGIRKKDVPKIEKQIRRFKKKKDELTTGEFSEKTGLSITKINDLYGSGVIKGRIRDVGGQPIRFIKSTEVEKIRNKISDVIPITRAALLLGKSWNWLKDRIDSGEIKAEKTLYGRMGIRREIFDRLKEKTYLTIPEACKQLDTSETPVRVACEKGEIKATKKYGKWQISLREIERLKAKMASTLTVKDISILMNLNPYTLRRHMRSGNLKFSGRPLFSWASTRYGIKISDLSDFVKKYFIKKGVPEDLDELDPYVPLLPKIERRIVLRAKFGDVSAQTFLIKSHARRIRSLIFRIIGQQNEDLESEANIGLLNAMRRFDIREAIKRETPFWAFAYYFVKWNVIGASMRDRLIQIPLDFQSKMKWLRKKYFELRGRLGREPTYMELASEIKMPKEKEKVRLLDLFFPPKIDSLDKQIYDDEGRTLYDILGTNDMDVVLSNLELRSVLEILISRLPRRQKHAITLRFGINGASHSIKEIARRMKMTEMGIYSMVRKALENMRKEYEKQKKI